MLYLELSSIKEETTPRTFMNTFLNVKDTALIALDELEDNSKIEICIYEPLFKTY